MPNAAPTSQTESAHLFNIFSHSLGCAFVVKSKSLPSLPKIASRTGPPTNANLKPASLKAFASAVLAGACLVSVLIASSVAALIGVFTVALG
ncbi:unannotated protein [freshwater metagenome]|uniref:Unannotated protein n=1 Tax=freshwater metagenome TaxID=449393 RepID=A0A6J6V3K6_9ZZZZ